MRQSGHGTYRRKLIEVALPLVEISEASIADKSRRVGTIKNLHKWFAAMPAPALRALIFASLVDDPGDEARRQGLIQIIKALVPKDGAVPTDDVLREAKRRITDCNPELPMVLDPFCGGGSTIVEALRLGLSGISSDLNPVAVLVTRTLCEVLPPIASAPAISSSIRQRRIQDLPFDGFADDLRHYGALVQQAALDKVGKHYPVPTDGNPVAWLWARTAACPNPMCAVKVPLFGSPWLSKQPGREATIEAVVEGDIVRFIIRKGKDSLAHSTKGAGRLQFSCPKCNTSLGEKELRAAGKRGELGIQLMAFCIDTETGRTFLGPDEVPHNDLAVEIPTDLDDIEIGAQDSRTIPYGITLHRHLYSRRQLAMLATLADEVAIVYERVLADGGSAAQARAIATVLGLCVGKMAQSNSSLVRWLTRRGPSKAEPAFARQSIQMYWDYAEAYPFGTSVGSWEAQIKSIIGLLRIIPSSPVDRRVVQLDARQAGRLVPPGSALIVTDPPYFDQINYADLSDYFYFWLRRALRDVHPDLFDTIATPKSAELVANHIRHGGSREAARQYFIAGFTEVFTSLQRASRPDLPIVVAYAARQDDREKDGVVSSAWVALLEAVLASGLSVIGTLPIEATRKSRLVSLSSNALASYIILICRPRQAKEIADRNTFLSRLQDELPEAVEALRKGGVSPLDMGQASIGPGMRIFSEYREVLEPTGSPMKVRDALLEIDKVATAVIDGVEQEYDAVTRFCLQWFRLHAFDVHDYGDADKILRRTGTAIRDLVAVGVVQNIAGKVGLLSFDELRSNYDPSTAERISHWEVALRLAKLFDEQGIDGAARLVAAVRNRTDVVISLDRINRLVHRLFKISERRYTTTATKFNQLGAAWSDIMTAAESLGAARDAKQQIEGFFSTTEVANRDE